jgi:6-pyruvoyltetrahydropterin/6-carboxytetrahydropterin synthase
MNQIHKDFSWDMGHRISKHGGKCFSPHGHFYRAVVWLNGSLNDNGMVLDYYQLSQIVNPIVEELDHSFMVYRKDEIMAKFFEETLANSEIKPFKVKWVSFESTAENIAKYIFDEVRKQTDMVEKVEVWETPKCCAVYSVSTS